MIIPDEVNMDRLFGSGGITRKGKTDYCPKQDKRVVIKGGELLLGEFNKQVVGTSSGGLNHIIWKEKG